MLRIVLVFLLAAGCVRVEVAVQMPPPVVLVEELAPALAITPDMSLEDVWRYERRVFGAPCTFVWGFEPAVSFAQPGAIEYPGGRLEGHFICQPRERADILALHDEVTARDTPDRIFLDYLAWWGYDEIRRNPSEPRDAGLGALGELSGLAARGAELPPADGPNGIATRQLWRRVVEGPHFASLFYAVSHRPPDVYAALVFE
jgi:hypothetical protein